MNVLFMYLRRYLFSFFLFMCFTNYSYSQLGGNNNGGIDPCAISFTVNQNSDGSYTICYNRTQRSLTDFIIECADGSQQLNDPFVLNGCFEMPCCENATELILSWTAIGNGGHVTHCTTTLSVEPCSDPDECEGNDSDGDGICDEDDCFPNDPNQSFAPGDLCDDGNPNTTYDFINDDCECVGTCGDVILDDGCDLTEDIIDANCNVSHIPPNVDDGCDLTQDYFDFENCVIVNQPPNIDDGCPGTIDSFDLFNCKVINESLPCDDGDPNTVNDRYNSNCECEGCDPCELDGAKWKLLCELLNRN